MSKEHGKAQKWFVYEIGKAVDLTIRRNSATDLRGRCDEDKIVENMKATVGRVVYVFINLNLWSIFRLDERVILFDRNQVSSTFIILHVGVIYFFLRINSPWEECQN